MNRVLPSLDSTLTLSRPDDWHLHLRDGPELASVLPYTARVFARAVVMPNLKPPVTTVELASRYRDRIRAALPAGSDFEPLMTLYLTDATPAAEIDRAALVEVDLDDAEAVVVRVEQAAVDVVAADGLGHRFRRRTSCLCRHR